MSLATGSKLPEFNLPGDGGDPVSSVQLLGKPFVLFLYPKDDTQSCTIEAVDFSALSGDFAKLGVAVIGMSPDNIKRHAKFRAKHGLTVALVSDESKQTLMSFGVWVEKSMYGQKYMGVERTTLLVDRQGKVAKLWQKVKVSGHAAEVLAAAHTLIENG